MLTLTPGTETLVTLEAIWRTGAAVRLNRDAKPAVEAAADLVRRAAEGGEAVYGVNTGFGKLASVKIAAKDTATLQRNLILSHCCGVGDTLDIATTRLMMSLKLLSLGRGASGVAWTTVELIEAMLAKGVTPVIPDQGSVGASGDLAPLAHMAAAMLGEGQADYDGETLPAAQALSRAGLSPIVLGPKEGLALINGTQFSTACALVGLFDAWQQRTDGGCDLRPVDRRDHGFDRAAGGCHPHAARPCRPDRGRPRPTRADGRLGNPREPPRGRQPGAGSLLHPLPAAGDWGGH